MTLIGPWRPSNGIRGLLDHLVEPGASHGHAVAVADFLNRNIVAITLT